MELGVTVGGTVGVAVPFNVGVKDAVGTGLQPLFTEAEKELLTKGTPPVLNSIPASISAKYQLDWIKPRARASWKKAIRFKLVTEVTRGVIW